MANLAMPGPYGTTAVCSPPYASPRAGVNTQILGAHLLRELHGVVALPACRFHLHGRGTQGLIWDPLANDLVVSALPAVVSLPARREIQLDAAELEAQAGQASAQAPTLERTAVFGGSLLRHFGHFCHESLARLWWLGQGIRAAPSAKPSAQTFRH